MRKRKQKQHQQEHKSEREWNTHTHSANQIDGGIVCYIDNYVEITVRKNGRIPD